MSLHPGEYGSRAPIPDVLKDLLGWRNGILALIGVGGTKFDNAIGGVFDHISWGIQGSIDALFGKFREGIGGIPTPVAAVGAVILISPFLMIALRSSAGIIGITGVI